MVPRARWFRDAPRGNGRGGGCVIPVTIVIFAFHAGGQHLSSTWTPTLVDALQKRLTNGPRSAYRGRGWIAKSAAVVARLRGQIHEEDT